ncbi:MAG: hypothetical protein HY983_00320 [Candidatus Magasanikbacteria bacterium]|nr:hypothetical protein [Candidatus Magasanikbacteria bacterium]
METKPNIIHRGKWEGQNFPNAFEAFRLYGGGVEADVMLLSDEKTLGVVHPADFKMRDPDIENMSPEIFAKLKVRAPDQIGGAAPFFREYVAGCYDRGIQVFFEAKGSTPEKAAQTARQIVVTIGDMRAEGAFKVQGKEPSRFIEQMGIHSFSPEAVMAAKKALEETGLTLRLGFTWLTSAEHVGKNPIAASALRYYHEGDTWENAGLKAAHELGCNYVFFVEPGKMTPELVHEAHEFGLELYVFIRSGDNSEELCKRLTSMWVDKLLF